jgi:hypothetical protein
MLIIKLKNIYIFNILKLVYCCFSFCDKEQKLLLYLNGTLKGHDHIHYNNFEIL